MNSTTSAVTASGAARRFFTSDGFLIDDEDIEIEASKLIQALIDKDREAHRDKMKSLPEDERSSFVADCQSEYSVGGDLELDRPIRRTAEEGTMTLGDVLASEAVHPYVEEMRRREMHATIDEAVAGDARKRAIIDLLDAGYTQEEIAEKQGCSRKTVQRDISETRDRALANPSRYAGLADIYREEVTRKLGSHFITQGKPLPYEIEEARAYLEEKDVCTTWIDDSHIVLHVNWKYTKSGRWITVRLHAPRLLELRREGRLELDSANNCDVITIPDHSTEPLW